MTSTSLLVQSNPSSLRRCKEENDIFRYFDDMQSIIRSRKIAIYNRKQRKRNLSFDLVGVELNPGPPKKSKSVRNAPNVAKKKKTSSSRTSRPGSSDALIGRRNANMSQSLSKSAYGYMISVLQPCSGAARIPDYNCNPTFLDTMTQEVTLTANAQGVLGLTMVIAARTQYYAETSASADAALVYGSAVDVGTPTTTSASFQRPVSACIDVMYIGATNSDQGLLHGGSRLVMNGSEEVAGNLTTVNSLDSLRSSDVARTKDGISIFYRPGDSTAFDFKLRNDVSPVGRLDFHANGLGSNAPVFVRMTVNYECISQGDAFSLTTGLSSPSPVDPSGHAVALNAVANIKPVLSRDTAVSLKNYLTPVMRGVKEYGPAIWNGISSILSTGSKFL